jgi:hypothetical protein
MNDKDYIQKLEETNRLLEERIFKELKDLRENNEQEEEDHKEDLDKIRDTYDKSKIVLRYAIADLEHILRKHGNIPVNVELVRVHSKLKELEKQFHIPRPFDP